MPELSNDGFFASPGSSPKRMTVKVEVEFEDGTVSEAVFDVESLQMSGRSEGSGKVSLRFSQAVLSFRTITKPDGSVLVLSEIEY